MKQRQHPSDELNDDYPETGQAVERERRPTFEQDEAHGFAAEDIVDDHLQGPRLEQLEAGDQEDLGQRPEEAQPIGRR